MSRGATPAVILEVTGLIGSALVQDLGRPGLAHLGIPASGAADVGALRSGNRMLGNADSAAGLEVMGSITLRAHAPLLVAVTGASGPVRLDGEHVPHTPLPLATGSELHLGPPRRGLRTYVSVRGGVDLPPVLGSRAHDTLSGIGPAPLAVGTRLPIGVAPRQVPTTSVEPGREIAHPGPQGLVMCDLLPGPRQDWVSDPQTLHANTYRVSELADRVGTRLVGPPLTRIRTEELASEGVVRGAVQIPPDGAPVILGADHPVTGGYPVVAVLTEAASDALAQARAGTVLRFRSQHLRWPRARSRPGTS